MITICPECGHQVPERATSCPECGCPISPAPDASASGGTTNGAASGGTGGTYQYKYHYTPKKSHGCRGCVIAIIVVALIALLCIGGLVFACFEFASENVFSGGTSHTITQSDDTTEWVADTTSAPSFEADSTSTDTITQEDNGDVVLAGYIGGTAYPIRMTLSINPDGDVNGNYIYTNRQSQKPVILLGNYQQPYLTIYESLSDDSASAAYFEGKYDGETFSGSYTNASGQEYAFMLKVEGK